MNNDSFVCSVSVFLGACIPQTNHMSLWERIFGTRATEEHPQDEWVHVPNEDNIGTRNPRIVAAFKIWSQLWKDEEIIMY